MTPTDARNAETCKLALPERLESGARPMKRSLVLAFAMTLLAAFPALADDMASCKLTMLIFREFSLQACSRIIETGEESDSNLPIALERRADIYRTSGRYPQAIADFDYIIRLQPNNAEAFANRGSLFGLTGGLDKAIADYSKAIELKPDNASYFLGRGSIYRRKGDNDRVIADLSKVIALKPDPFPWFRGDAYLALWFRCEAYYNKNDHDRAIADCGKAIQINPADIIVLTLRGRAYNGKRDFDRAIADFDKVIQKFGSYSDAYFGRGVSYISKGDNVRAIADFGKVIQLVPTSGASFFNRGLAYRAKGETALAIADFKIAAQFSRNDDPLNAKALAQIAQLEAKLAAEGQAKRLAAATPAATPTAPVAPVPPVPPIKAGRRVALVIGNSAYRNAPLTNPTIDADLVGTSLRKAGFDVTVVKDADFTAFDAALTAFSGAGRDADIALFYFAGHGFALSDGLRARNYLMSTSVDMQATSDTVLRRDGFPLDEVIARISAAPKVTLAFVDACRNDPFRRGAGNRGFARVGMQLDRQLYVGMSTQLGETALDGTDRAGSPFAQAFAETIVRPGLRIDDAFRLLRDQVSERTDGKQKPEILQDDLKQGSLVLVGQ